MKCRLAVLTAVLCSTPLTAQTTIGGRAGMTLSQLATADEGVEPSAIAGIHFGITASRMRGWVGLALSAAYTERGTGFTADELPEEVDFTFRLAYVEVATLGKVAVGSGPYLLAGPTLGLRVSCSASVSLPGSSQSTKCGDDSDDPFKIFDFGAAGGAGMSFDVVDFHMVVEALYGFGILNISDIADDSAMNRGLIIRVGADWIL